MTVVRRTVITSTAQAREWLAPVTKASLDTETTSLNYYDLQCLGISLCDGQRSCYINLEAHDIGVDLSDVETLIFHNAPFDMKVLHKLGIEHTEHIFDTQVAAHLLDEGGPTGLDDVGWRYLKEGKLTKFKTAQAHGTQSQTFFDYACIDAELTYRLMDVLWPLLQSEGLDRLFKEIEMPFQFVLRDMAINGLYVDQVRMMELTEELTEKIRQLYIETLEAGGVKYHLQYNMFGRPEVCSSLNLNSSQQLGRLLKRLGVKLSVNDNGHPVVDKHVLKGIKHPFTEALLKYKAANKLLTSYLSKWPQMIDGDGRLRPWFNGCGTVTGRLSSNMQQLPKDQGIVDLRSLFAAPPGRAIVAADYKGQELRVLAHESNDPTMMEAFFADKDLHLAIANQAFKLGIEDYQLFESSPEYPTIRSRYESERSKAKTVSFGLSYGKTAHGFAKDWGCSEEKAQKFIDEFFREFPRMEEAIQQTQQEIQHLGFVRTIFGRKRRLQPSKRAFRQGFNHKIQSASADMIRVAANKIRTNLKPEWKAEFILQVHDELVLECQRDYAEEVTKTVKQCMCTAVELCVPLRADVKWALNYGEAK